jgi:hypothetical protein
LGRRKVDHWVDRMADSMAAVKVVRRVGLSVELKAEWMVEHWAD